MRVDRASAAELGLMNCCYRGYGGFLWFGFDRGAVGADAATTIRNSLSGNHHISVPWRDRTDMAQSMEERARQQRLGDADLNCQLITTNQHGAVSLQHLWGY